MVTFSLQHADLLAWAHSGLKSIQADSAPNIKGLLLIPGSHFRILNVHFAAKLLHVIVAERLSARLLILQCVFSVGGVWYHASEMQSVAL